MVRWLFALIVIVIVGFFIYVKLGNKMPEDLGVTDGLLKPCPTSPNCVSTQASPDDMVHYVEPIIYTGDRKATQLKIESSMLSKGRIRIVSSTLGYVHFEVRSPLWGTLMTSNCIFLRATVLCIFAPLPELATLISVSTARELDKLQIF